MNPAKKLLRLNFNAHTFSTCAPNPPAIPKEQLATLGKIIKTHDGSNSTLPDKESLRQIYRQFITTPTRKLSSEFDAIRRIRQLAWTLTYTESEEPRIVDTPKLKSALHLIESRFRISMLYGIFNALLQAWDTPNAGALRAFLKKQLNGYTGSQKSVQKLKINIGWYCEENSSTNLAMYLVRSPNKLSEVWTFLELPDYMHSYTYFSAVAIAYTTFNNKINLAHVKDVVEFVKKHDNDKISRIVLSKLIEKLGSDASEDLRQPVQSYVLKKWQDPRLTGADVRWHDVSKEARQIFTRWITEKDIHFFFDVVAKTCNDPKFAYRKAFWLAYLGETDSGHIDSCRLVLRKDAEYLFRNNHYYQERKESIATLKGGNSNQHAFIIQMGEFTFVEFSTAGACYVYYNYDIDDNPALPFELGNSEYYMSELRCQVSAIRRVIHSNSRKYYWQKDFASWLEDEIGIEALRSYRLEGESSSERHINCPNEECKQTLRIRQATKGWLKITCPKCRTIFRYEVR